MDQLENVYETVDEKEYTKKVLSRQDDDWIVDDGNYYDSIPVKDTYYGVYRWKWIH